MDIRHATSMFERWLAIQTKLVRADLRHKRVAMGLDVFSFLRATYYRWAQQFPRLDAAISQAPKVLAVGDLHLENFGTWRDHLGRLAWGINDFDEAFELPFTHDLVRLATSALLAIDLEHLQLGAKAACRAIVEGYREGLEKGGRPFVIGEEHRWFRPMLLNPLRDPGLFWDKLLALPRERGRVPRAAKLALIEMLPTGNLAGDIRHRLAGLGNLGKARFTALAQWQGGPVAREAKVLTISAAAWAQNDPRGPFYEKILAKAIRSPDPFLAVHGGWVVRRLAPDCRRIELASLAKVKDEQWLLHAMGYETANVHLGSAAAQRAVSRHLRKLPKGWMRAAASQMRKLVMKDFLRWNGRG